MATPERIRAEAREAEAQLAALGAQARNATAEPAAPAPADPAPPPSLDDRAPGEAPHPNAVTPPPAPSDSGPITAEAYAELMQKYETLQGLHGRDRTKLHQIESQLEGMERMLAAQQVAIERSNQPPATPTPPAKTELVTADEVKEFGEDLIDVIRRVAREELSSPIHSILDDVQRLRTGLAAVTQNLQNTSTVVADVAENRFNQTMDRLVTDAAGNPDWDAINTSHLNGDTKFVDWLKQTGQDSDEPRQSVLVRAYQRKDAEKCAGLFNAFKDAHGLPRGDGRSVSRAPQAAPAANPADAIVSPSPVAPSVPSTTRGRGNQKVWTLAEITKIYDDNTKGLNKTDAQKAEYKRLTAEIDAATADGRIKA